MNSSSKFALAMSHVQLKQLKQLVVVAEKKSIRAAAHQLAMTQPALSRSIRNLEHDLGVSLVERGTKGIELTEFGRALIHYATLINANLRFAADELETLLGAPTGKVNLGTSPMEGFFIGAEAISELLKNRPNAQVSIIEGNSDMLIPKLLNGDIDFMLGPLPSDTIMGISSEIVTRMRSLIVVRSSHPLARSSAVGFADLTEATWILPSSGTLAAARLKNAFLKMGLIPPRSVIEAPAFSLINVSLLLRQDFVGVLPSPLIGLVANKSELTILPIDTTPLDAPVYLAKRELGVLPPACRDLIGHIKAICRREPAADPSPAKARSRAQVDAADRPAIHLPSGGR